MVVSETNMPNLTYEAGGHIKISTYWENRGYAEIGFTRRATGESIGLYPITPDRTEILRGHKILDSTVELVSTTGEPVL